MPVDSYVLAVKINVAGGTVGIAFKDDVNIRRDAKELAELLGEDTGTQVFQRDLETPGTVIVEDLDGN